MINKREYILSKFPDASPNMSGSIHTHCPFHDDRKPSFSIDVEEGLFICGSSKCGLRGNFPLFYKLMENIKSWRDVWEDLKSTTTDFNINDLFKKQETKNKIQDLIEFPANECLEEIGHLDYLESRGLGRSVIDTFGLRYGKVGKVGKISLSGTLVCPVWDLDFSYRTFQLRTLLESSSSRWFNPPGSPIQHLLYGGWVVGPASGTLWIVEGASDVWKLYSYGVQSVGLNTKEASPSQLNKIIKSCKFLNLRPVVCMDGDALDAGKKLHNELDACGIYPLFVELRKDEDPGSLTVDRLTEVWRNCLNV